MSENLKRSARAVRALALAKTRRLSAALRAGGIYAYAQQARLSFLPSAPADPEERGGAGNKSSFGPSRRQREAELSRAQGVSASVNGLEELFLTDPGVSFKELAVAVLAEACRLTDSRFGVAGYRDGVTGRIVAVALYGKARKTRPAKKSFLVSPYFAGLWGRVLKRKKPLLANYAPSAARVKAHKFLGVPAVYGRELLGILALSEPRGDYSADELRTVSRLARVYALLLKRKLDEDGRRREHDALLALISSSQDIVYSADMAGKIVYASPRVAAYGYRPKDLLGRSIFDLVHPQDREMAVKALANARETGRTLPMISYRLRKKSAGYFFMEQKSGIVKSGGKPALITGVVRDVGRKAGAAALLKENEAMFRNIFETSGDAIFIKDLIGRYVKVNKACADSFQLTRKGVLGRTDAEIFSPAAARTFTLADREVIRTGKTISRTYDRALPAGSHSFNTVRTPLRNAGGELIGVLGVARDITGIKKTEGELAGAKAAEALKKAALPMAHDFNNALAVINGYATLLDEGTAASSPAKAGIGHILSAVKWAAELTAQFQTFARSPKPGSRNGGGQI